VSAASTPGWGGCGCERPDRHQPGCLWQLDRRGKRIKVGKRRGAALYVPRPGCCIICGRPLDPGALRDRDDRCTRCYRALFQRRAADILGGGGVA
jgi:hypothetical protein